jgi:anti-sigma factor RsiW
MMADEHPRSQGDDVDCVEVVEILTDYLEGPLPERERRRLENHLAACPGCAEYVAQMRAMAGSLGGLREDAIPADLREAVLAAFRDPPRR